MRRLIAIALLCLSGLPCSAGTEEIEPLDAEFLEYLAAFGSDSEDWALFASDDEPVEPAAGKQNVAKEGGLKKTEAADKPADKR